MRNTIAPNNSRGSVLVISLLMLLVLTMLGVTALDSTVMEERMSVNNRQHNLAHQAAEAALKNAENWLSNAAGNVVSESDISKFAATNELYNSMVSTRSRDWDTMDPTAWLGDNSQGISSLDNYPADMSIIPGAPRYVIEYIGRVGNPPLSFTDPDLRSYAFRVTAIGWGTDRQTNVILSSTFKKRLS